MPQADQRVHIAGNADIAGNEQRPFWIAEHEVVENGVDLVDFPLQLRGELRARCLAFGRMAQLVRNAVGAHAQTAGVVQSRRGTLELP